MHPDGREEVFDGDTHQMITSDRYRGTYNYVNPAPIPDGITDVTGIGAFIGKGIGHLLIDLLPYAIGGNVRGPN